MRGSIPPKKVGHCLLIWLLGNFPYQQQIGQLTSYPQRTMQEKEWWLLGESVGDLEVLTSNASSAKPVMGWGVAGPAAGMLPDLGHPQFPF